MKRFAGLALRYRTVVLTVVVGLIGVVFWAVGLPVVVQFLFSGFALVVAVVTGIRTVRDLAHGRLGVDLLAVIALLATVLVGEYVASLIIVVMVAGGKALEDYAESRAQRELSALLAREPQIAHVLKPPTGEATDVVAGEVVVGDLLLIRSGEVVPTDGTLESETGGFDESSLTGESMPMQHVSGNTVLSGSVNGLNTAVIRATSTAANSQFQGIIALVRHAQQNRAPVVRLADRYALPFTAVSLAIAATAWALSHDAVRFAEVLVLATPCPLVLAAPVAFMGGMSRAARNGIIVKGGSVLEGLARVRTAVFDKTGTLTLGTPTITRILTEPPLDEDSLLALVASAERFSSHVLAASIVVEADRRRLPHLTVRDSTEQAARGIEATVGDQRVCVGTFAFVSSLASDVLPAPTSGGELAIYVAVDGRFGGCVIASDPARANARGTISSLRDRGVHDIIMLTGDARDTAEHVASDVGIANLHWDCLPADKVAVVHELQARPVMMVGDGVNDAPVLAAAEVGIAMGARGATAASESAAAVILVDDLSRTLLAIDIGRETVRIALQSIWLGIALSVILMVIAAFGIIPATLGAALQELVDLAAILNALRAVHAPSRITASAAGEVTVRPKGTMRV